MGAVSGAAAVGAIKKVPEPKQSCAAVAAPDQHMPRILGSAILSAAMALPGLIPSAHADSAPESGIISYKYLSYRDRQPGLDRITATAPSWYVLFPVGRQWAFSGSQVTDSVSGASSRYHSAISGASQMKDTRQAHDLKVTRYFERASLSIGTAKSSEHDYGSDAVNITGTLSSENNNTTWTLGLGNTDDSINPVNNVVVDEKKNTRDYLLGVSQVLTPNDIVQVSMTYADGHGYYDDPYKSFDKRPRDRRQSAILTKWNHHLEGGSILQSSYRYYHDSWGIQGDTFTLDWVKPLSDSVTITPSVRYHTQGAASFYYDPVNPPLFGIPFLLPGFPNLPPLYSQDQRLSAFGVITAGLKLSKSIEGGWVADIRADYYEQKSAWRWLDKGSPGLDTLTATIFQVGLSKKFK